MPSSEPAKAFDATLLFAVRTGPESTLVLFRIDRNDAPLPVRPSACDRLLEVAAASRAATAAAAGDAAPEREQGPPHTRDRP